MESPESRERFNVCWNNYSGVIKDIFLEHLRSQRFVDVTLACEGHSIKCHRTVLAACSTYFDKLLADNPSPNLIILMTDLKLWQLRALVTYMYHGNVSVCADQLPALCKAAEALQVKGLTYQEGDELIANLDGRSSKEPQNESSHEGPLEAQPNSSGQKSKTLPEFIASQEAKAKQRQKNKRKVPRQPPKLTVMTNAERPVSGRRSVMEIRSEPPLLVPAVENGDMRNGNPNEPLVSNVNELQPGQGQRRESVPPSPQVFQSQVNEYSSGVNGVVNPHPPSASGVPMDSAERAERCNRASELALSGISVQRAADRYGIPRSTLCSFMRRNGLLESRNQVLHNNGMEGYHQQHTTPTPTQVTNEQIQVGSYTHFQNFPFLGLSEVVEGMDQTNCAAGGYMQGYGNYGGG